MSLPREVKRNLKNTGLFNNRATIIVGVSGGADSMALMHILHGLQYELGFHLHVAHYNHNLRRSARADQKFVESAAEELNIPCSVETWQNPKEFKKGSLEDAARRHRFQFFNALAKQISAQAVVLAHTKDDLAETVLMRILRGTGLQGLRGILPRRELDGVCFIRPLLGVKKERILSFLKKKNIAFRFDPTNKQKKFFRNKIRLELMPLLTKKYNQNIVELLTNLANNSGTDYDYLETQAEAVFRKYAKYFPRKKALSFALEIFTKQHSAIRRMLLRLGIKKLNGDTNRITLTHFYEIEDLLENRPKNSIVHLPKNIAVQKNSHHLILSDNSNVKC